MVKVFFLWVMTLKSITQSQQEHLSGLKAFYLSWVKWLSDKSALFCFLLCWFSLILILYRCTYVHCIGMWAMNVRISYYLQLVNKFVKQTFLYDSPKCDHKWNQFNYVLCTAHFHNFLPDWITKQSIQEVIL